MRGGGGGGGCCPLQARYKIAGGGGAVRFRPDTKGGGGGGGGCCPFKARYEKRRGGVLFSASGPIQKAGKGEGLFSR